MFYLTTFQEFAHDLFLPVSYFVDWLGSVANSLINNYIFQTLLCLTIIFSLFWLFYNSIFDFFDSYMNKVDIYLSKKQNYEMYRQIKREYFDEYPDLEYKDKYKSYSLSREVYDDYFDNNTDLVKNFKLKNLVLNKIIDNEYLQNYSGLEEANRLSHYIINKDVASRYMTDFKWEDINGRLLAMENKGIAQRMRMQDLNSQEKIEALSDDVANVFADYQDIDMNNNGINNLKSKNSKYKVVEPSWLNNDIAKEDISDDEKKELDKMLGKDTKVKYTNIDDIPSDILKQYDMSSHMQTNLYTKDGSYYFNVDTGEIYYPDSKGYINFNGMNVMPKESPLFNFIDDIN